MITHRCVYQLLEDAPGVVQVKILGGPNLARYRAPVVDLRHHRLPPGQRPVVLDVVAGVVMDGKTV